MPRVERIRLGLFKSPSRMNDHTENSLGVTVLGSIRIRSKSMNSVCFHHNAGKSVQQACPLPTLEFRRGTEGTTLRNDQIYTSSGGPRALGRNSYRIHGGGNVA